MPALMLASGDRVFTSGNGPRGINREGFIVRIMKSTCEHLRLISEGFAFCTLQNHHVYLENPKLACLCDLCDEQLEIILNVKEIGKDLSWDPRIHEKIWFRFNIGKEPFLDEKVAPIFPEFKSRVASHAVAGKKFTVCFESGVKATFDLETGEAWVEGSGRTLLRSGYKVWKGGMKRCIDHRVGFAGNSKVVIKDKDFEAEFFALRPQYAFPISEPVIVEEFALPESFKDLENVVSQALEKTDESDAAEWRAAKESTKTVIKETKARLDESRDLVASIEASKASKPQASKPQVNQSSKTARRETLKGKGKSLFDYQ